MKEIFRLNEDEAAVVQMYRMLSDETKQAVMMMLKDQTDQLFAGAGNVVLFFVQNAK